MPLHLASHPVISAKMTALRDRNTKTVDFRRLLKDITNFVGFEATRTLKCSKLEVTTPMGATHTGSETASAEGKKLTISNTVSPVVSVVVANTFEFFPPCLNRSAS